MTFKLLSAGIVIAGLSQEVQAQTVPTIPSDVETVASGGYWTSTDSLQGHYRVVISTEGFEHQISRLWVQWVADPTEPDSLAQVLRAEEVPIGPPAAGVHLTRPRLNLEGRQWFLYVDATNTHCDPMAVDRWRIELQASGRLKVLGSTVIKRGCT